MASSSPPRVVEDMPPFLQLLSDGTVIRFEDYNTLPPPSPPPGQPVVEWKDVVYDADHDLKLRVYKPPGGASGKKKFPMLVYFHGGGYCIGSFNLPNFHACCVRLAGELPAVVLSADYRLAPEHRLPSAHDDGAAVLSWLRGHAVVSSGADPWLAESADFERVFVCGDSAGGNIAHHLAVRHGSGGLALDPVRLAGCVMLCPYFGGEERMASELAAPADMLMSLALFDQMWRLALPAGANRDHPAANPFGPESAPLDGVAFPPVFVVDPEKDLLRDRVADYVARMKAMGKPVELVEFEGQEHAFFIYEPWGSAADELVRVLRRFVHGGSPASTT